MYNRISKTRTQLVGINERTTGLFQWRRKKQRSDKAVKSCQENRLESKLAGGGRERSRPSKIFCIWFVEGNSLGGLQGI